MKLVLTSIECHLVGILYVVEKKREYFPEERIQPQHAAGEAGRAAAASVGAADSEVRGLAA